MFKLNFIGIRVACVLGFGVCSKARSISIGFPDFSDSRKDYVYRFGFYWLLFYTFYTLFVEGSYFDGFFFNAVAEGGDLGSGCSSVGKGYSVRSVGPFNGAICPGLVNKKLALEIIRSAYQEDLLKVETVGDFLREYSNRRNFFSGSENFVYYCDLGYDVKETMQEFKDNYVHIPRKLWIDKDYASLSITLRYAGKPTLAELHQSVSNEVWKSFRKAVVSEGAKPFSVSCVDYFFETGLTKDAPSLLGKKSIKFIEEFPRLVQEGVWKEVLEAKEIVFSDCYHIWNSKWSWGYWEGKHWWDSDKSLAMTMLPDWRASLFEYFLKYIVRLDSEQLELVSKELRCIYWSDVNTGTSKATNRLWYPEGPKLDLSGKDHEEYYTPNTQWVKYAGNDIFESIEHSRSRDTDLLASEVRENRKLVYKELVAKEAEAMGWVNWYNRRASS